MVLSSTAAGPSPQKAHTTDAAYWLLREDALSLSLEGQSRQCEFTPRGRHVIKVRGLANREPRAITGA